ncbi:UDP-N-acetylglucosamine 1-carboxyvinyltransferase [Thermocrinis sp.]
MTNTTLSGSDFLLVEGGKRLKGAVKISGSKNASLPIMMATLLTKEPCVVRNVPTLLDVKNAVELLELIGANVKFEDHNVFVEVKRLQNYVAPDYLVRRMRASILVAGPLLARLGKAVVGMPGGCSIGARLIDQHLKVFEKGGAFITVRNGYIHMEVEKIKPVEHTFEVITVTGTENALMFLSRCEKRSILRNTALEPEVIDLIEVLRKMGVDIEVEGRTMVIRGNPELRGFDHTVIPDRIEAGTLAVAGFITGGDVVLEGVCPEHMGSQLEKLKEAGAVIEILGLDKIRVIGNSKINPLEISTSEYPGFPTDMQAQFTVLCCIADGVSQITENIFENRFQHVNELQRMGAKINLKGRTAIVFGQDRLSGAEVFSTDLRASASLVLAGLVAEGTTVVREIHHLDRGYERLEDKLNTLGARIERITNARSTG